MKKAIIAASTLLILTGCMTAPQTRVPTIVETTTNVIPGNVTVDVKSYVDEDLLVNMSTHNCSAFSYPLDTRGLAKSLEYSVRESFSGDGPALVVKIDVNNITPMLSNFATGPFSGATKAEVELELTVTVLRGNKVLGSRSIFTRSTDQRGVTSCANNTLPLTQSLKKLVRRSVSEILVFVQQYQ